MRARDQLDPSQSDQIAVRMLAPMIKECQRAVEEGVVDSFDDADAGMIFGTGFPSFRGGPLNWAN